MIRINRALDARLVALRKDGDKGFTLIELLVVVIIIGILAAIAIPVYLGIQNNARDSAVKSDVANMKTAIVAFTVRTGAIPAPSTTAGVNVLAADGYAGPSAGSYATTSPGSPTFSTGTSTAATGSVPIFCVLAHGITGNYFGATDSSGVIAVSTAATCSAGALVP